MNRDQQRAFFEERWPDLKLVLETEGTIALIEALNRYSGRERIALYSYARLGLALDDWQSKTLDAYIEVADAGLDWLITEADATDDDPKRRELIEAANVISFNLAADLADCWPGDELEREDTHFARGRRAGAACVAWREELDVAPSSRQLGWWALGYHQLRLGDHEAALESFDHALRWAVEDAERRGDPTEVGPGASFAINLNHGYRAIVRSLLGHEGAGRELQETMAAFGSQKQDPAKAEDAQFGIDQLGKVRDLVGA